MGNFVILYVIISYLIIGGYSVAEIRDESKCLDDLDIAFVFIRSIISPISLFYVIGKALYKINDVK